MVKLFVLPYNRASKSAKVISRALNAKRIKLRNSRFTWNVKKLIINWGQTNDIGFGFYVNHPSRVSAAVNKLNALTILKECGIKVPAFTSNVNEARQWFDANPDAVVFCRTLLRSSGGKGIVIAETADQLVRAPLYTKRIKKAEEYRIHVFDGEVIDVVKKKLRNGQAGRQGRNPYIRNHDNGWVFAHDNVECPDNVKQEAVKAVTALGLNFGAVDIGVTKKGLPFVFEVNTAPGIENDVTIKSYINAFNNYKNKHNANLQGFY